METQMVALDGVVESVVFHNEENGYTVLDVDVSGELITVVGSMGNVGEGDRIRVMGEYGSHPSFGLQFKAFSCEVRLPEGARAIERYLASGAIKGIKGGLAKRIVDHFGDETLSVIEEEPERLSEVRGISSEKAEKIAEEFQKVFGMRTVMAYLSRFSIPNRYAVRLWKQYGALSTSLLQENPFVLCQSSIGLPFTEADGIRSALEMSVTVPCRLRAGLLFLLQQEQGEGNSCCLREILFQKTGKLLRVDPAFLEEPLLDLCEDQSTFLVEREGSFYVSLQDAYQAERSIAENIALKMRANPSVSGQEKEKKALLKRISALEREQGITYADLQKEAIQEALLSPVMILTGGPGTGKTTALQAVIELLEQDGEKVALVAPTGRAAKRIGDLTGREGKTIHRLLGVAYKEDDRQEFVHTEKNLLDCDALVLDELSMVDIFVFASLLRALRMSCKLILVGDSDQLPPVGVGNVLKDLLDSHRIPVVTLTEIFRQAAKSLIVWNAHAIIEGKKLELSQKKGDFFLLPRGDSASIVSTVLDLCARRLPEAYGFSPFSDIQVLCPTKKNSVGTALLNTHLQERLNPLTPGKHEVNRGGVLFREGDKVMQVRNNYDLVWRRPSGMGEEERGTGIFNGDIGTVLLIDNRAKTLKIQFDDREADYVFEQLYEIDLAYAVTIHKSQGSEFPAVIIPLSPAGGRMYYRNLLYTGVTRAKQILILVGAKQTVEKMVATVVCREKETNLRTFLDWECGGSV